MYNYMFIYIYIPLHFYFWWHIHQDDSSGHEADLHQPPRIFQRCRRRASSDLGKTHGFCVEKWPTNDGYGVIGGMFVTLLEGNLCFYDGLWI